MAFWMPCALCVSQRVYKVVTGRKVIEMKGGESRRGFPTTFCRDMWSVSLRYEFLRSREGKKGAQYTFNALSHPTFSTPRRRLHNPLIEPKLHKISVRHVQNVR